MSYSGQVPETRREVDWRARTACHDQDRELFFPTGGTAEVTLTVAAAKTICLRCPVWDECLQFALDEHITFGIYGGLTEDERHELRKTKGQRAAEDIEAARQPYTLATVVAEHAREQADGHLVWGGPRQILYAGVTYTPRRASFELDRGEKPSGQVHTTCGVTDCVAADHLEDSRERYVRQLAERPAV